MVSEPLYQSVANDLKKKIECNGFFLSDKLPTEQKLTEIYNVSRVTIRQAINILVNENYITKKQGSGNFINSSKSQYATPHSASIISFSEEMKSLNKIPTYKVVKFELIQPDAQTATELELSAGDQVFYYERLRLGDDFPYCIEKGFLPFKLFNDFSVNVLTTSKMNYLESEKQIQLSHSYQIVEAIIASKYEAQLLNTLINTPLLKITHINYDTHNNPIEKIIDIFDSRFYHAEFIKIRKRND